MNLISKLVAWFGLALSWSLVHSPIWFQRGIGAILGMMWFDVLRIRRNVVIDNLTKAFPKLSRREKVRLGRRSLANLGMNLVEYSHLPYMSKKNIDDLFTFQNFELLDDALKEGHGVLLLTCHMGNGDLACAGLALKNYSILLVSKAFKLKWLNDLWFGMRRKSGLEFIPARDSSYALLKALKKNSIVVIPLDQFTGPPIGVKTTFFGHETGTAAGLALMAERAHSPVIACFTRRLSDGRHVLEFRKRIDVHFASNRAEGMVEYTQKFNDILEGFVTEHPDQWMWIHKRWKRFVVT
jgi:Kdo2-lipid IVA lauroyltransferase/acyltransferase